MTITNLQVQNIIKAYRVQSAVRSRLAREKVPRTVIPRDEVTLSVESKKRLLAEKITQGVMQQILRGADRSETIEQALFRLSQEYGKDLSLVIENEETMVFKEPNPESPGETRPLSPEENQALKSRLFDITRALIYSNLI